MAVDVHDDPVSDETLVLRLFRLTPQEDVELSRKAWTRDTTRGAIVAEAITRLIAEENAATSREEQGH